MTTLRRDGYTWRHTAPPTDPAPTDRVYVAVGPLCWGQGRTAKTALRLARTNMPVDQTWQWIVYLVSEDWAIHPIDGTVSASSLLKVGERRLVKATED